GRRRDQRRRGEHRVDRLALGRAEVAAARAARIGDLLAAGGGLVGAVAVAAREGQGREARCDDQPVNGAGCGHGVESFAQNGMFIVTCGTTASTWALLEVPSAAINTAAATACTTGEAT